VDEENEEEEDEDAPKVGEVLPFTFDDVESSIPVMKGVIEKMETLFKFIVSENEGSYYSLIHLLTHSLTYLLTHSPTYSLTYSLTHSLLYRS